MANLKDTASLIMDLYFQNYPTDEGFFNENHFLYLAGVAWAKVLEDEYLELRRNSRAEDGYTNVHLNPAWLIEEEIEVKLKPGSSEIYEGQLKTPVFGFAFDPYGRGVQSIRNNDITGCRNFIRSSERESWMDCIVPMTKHVFFIVKRKGVIQLRSPQCQFTTLVVEYVPDITTDFFGEDGGAVPKSKEDAIIRRALDLMINARSGTVVDMTNDSNPNKAIQSEINDVFNKLKTKPVS